MCHKWISVIWFLWTQTTQTDSNMGHKPPIMLQLEIYVVTYDGSVGLTCSYISCEVHVRFRGRLWYRVRRCHQLRQSSDVPAQFRQNYFVSLSADTNTAWVLLLFSNQLQVLLHTFCRLAAAPFILVYLHWLLCVVGLIFCISFIK